MKDDYPLCVQIFYPERKPYLLGLKNQRRVFYRQKRVYYHDLKNQRMVFYRQRRACYHGLKNQIVVFYHQKRVCRRDLKNQIVVFYHQKRVDFHGHGLLKNHRKNVLQHLCFRTYHHDNLCFRHDYHRVFFRVFLQRILYLLRVLLACLSHHHGSKIFLPKHHFLRFHFQQLSLHASL